MLLLLFFTQIEACMRETEKLGALITTNSPVITTFISVHVIIASEVRTSFLAHPASSAPPQRVVYSPSAASFLARQSSYRTLFLYLVLGVSTPLSADIIHRIVGYR